MKRRPRVSARGIVISYAMVAAIWIAFSDRLAAAMAPSQDALATISTLKGWAFVAVTSALLAGMLAGLEVERARRTRELETEVAERERALIGPAVADLTESAASASPSPRSSRRPPSGRSSSRSSTS